MNILIYNVPYMMNAAYFILVGYANAFRILGHTVREIEHGDPLPDQADFVPDLSMSFFHIAYSEKTDYRRLAELKAEYGTRIVIWGSPFDVPSLKYTDEHIGHHPPRHLRLMESNLFDLCISFYPPEGIESYYRKWTHDFGVPVLSLPLAADTAVYRPCRAEERFKDDLCFIGGINRTKQDPFYEYIQPLLKNYSMTVSGRGWEGWPIRWISLPYGEESALLSSVSIAPNVHMELSRAVPGMALNMRAFQSVAGGAFVISDHVPALRHYFSEEEMPVGISPGDFKEKVDYFMHHPEERKQHWLRAYHRVLKEHTYVHRVKRLLEAIDLSGEFDEADHQITVGGPN